jgi:S1-C subfamily serine protease
MVLWVVLFRSTAACGGAESGLAPAASALAPTSPPAASRGGGSAADHTLTRSAVHAAVVDGLGVLLQRVEIDDQPVMLGGKFHGFRITALRDPEFWAGVDLKPGDVVTAVNGMPIERPEQAQAALESLEAAPQLRVAFERDGHLHELVYAIVGGR